MAWASAALPLAVLQVRVQPTKAQRARWSRASAGRLLSWRSIHRSGQECSRVHAYYIKTGKLRALAVTSATRSEVLPDIPAVAEFVPAMRLASGSASVCPRTRPPRLSTSSIRRSTRASPIPVEGTFRGPCTLLTRSAHPEGVAFALRRPDHCSVGDGCGGKCIAGTIDRDPVSRESSYMPAGCQRRAADSGRWQF
jgi:hypothetical protein